MTTAYRLAPVTDLTSKLEGDGRTLEVLLAPWNTPATVDDGEGRYTETLARGALVPAAGRVVGVYRDHNGPLIGRLDSHWDNEDGLYGNLRIADTAEGRDTLALLAERVVEGVSVEFEIDDAPAHRGADVTRTGPLAMTGVALVPYPAYQQATVLSARSEPPTMTHTEPDYRPAPGEPDVDPGDEPEPETQPEPDGDGPEAAAEAQRRGLVLKSARRSQVTQVRARPRFESFGHFVLDQAKRYNATGERADEYARTVGRALVDEITTDVPGLMHETWLPSVIGIINKGRVTANAFGTASLPDGESIVWPEYTGGPAVGPQTAEKTAVPSAKVTVIKQSSDINTYGGAQDVSIQTILRSSPSYVTMLMELFAEKLGEQVNSDAVLNLQNATTTDVTLPAAPIVDAATAHAMLVAVANGAAQVISGGGTPSVFVIGPALWALFSTAVDTTGRVQMPASAPSNPIGSTSFTTMSGSWMGMTWVLDPTLTTPATVAGFIGDPTAFRSFLSPIGNLSVDVPEKLGRDIGVYQFASYALLKPKQVVVFKGPLPAPLGFADDDEGSSRSKKS
jgi:HK97 family phage prohead protease